MNSLQITPPKPIVFPSQFPLIENRCDRNAPFFWNQCYFLGFSVNTSEGVTYKHAMFIADSHNNLMVAIDDFTKSVVDFVKVKSKGDISVVFLYNLMTHDPKLSAQARELEWHIENLNSTIDAHDMEFTAIVYSMDIGFYLLKTPTKDALDAIEDAKIDVLELSAEKYLPTLAFKSHPVTKDMKQALRVAIQGFTQLLSCTAITTDYLH